MGNRNQSQRHSMRKYKSNNEVVQNRLDERQVIDLDEIVESWIWSMWNKTKTKSLRRYKRESLVINIDWTHVNFIQGQTQLNGLPPVQYPQSQILFRTYFNNQTASEHSYLLKTERVTWSKFEFNFTRSLNKSQESFMIFHLPEEIVNFNSDIQRDQSVKFGQHTINEYATRWQVDSQVRVAPHTRTHAELSIDEEEFHGDFTVPVQFFGRISATVVSRDSAKTCLKLIDGDIVKIFHEAMEKQSLLDGFQILEENSPVVQFIMRGKCSFRYGVQQHITLNQEPLSLLSSNDVANPTVSTPCVEYRPLRPYLVQSNNNLHLHIQDDELL